MMTNHARWLLPLSAVALAGCATEGALDIRPIGRQASAAGQPANVRVALAHGHLALGNVALALEEYRRAEREQPGSVPALAGMAECYRLMGRTDLARRYYEQALAVAPAEPALYLALATALDEGGEVEAARSLRVEAATRVSDRSKPAVIADAPVVRLSEPMAVAANLPQPVPMPKPSAQAPRAASVTVTLPPARPIAPVKHAARLERLSSGEVALLTSVTSPWAARQVAVNVRSVKVQYDKRDTIVVLNAARVEGIAARTRDYLASRGFSGARIGDAPMPRAHTLIRFPSTARVRALRIAAQFSFAPRMEQGEGPLTLIVGRDAAARRAGQASQAGRAGRAG